MDLSKLDSVSSEGLQMLRDRCVELLAKRNTTQLRRGAIAWFMDSSGTKRHIYITRINTKTVSGEEMDPITRVRIPHKTWRVTPRLLNIVGDVASSKPATVHRPSTAAAALW